MPSVVEEAKELVGRPDVRLMSLMDHTRDNASFATKASCAPIIAQGRGMTDAELDTLFERRFAYQKAYAATNMREIRGIGASARDSRWPVTTNTRRERHRRHS